MISTTSCVIPIFLDRIASGSFLSQLVQTGPELDAPPSKSATGHDRPPDLTDLLRADSREWCFSIKSARLAF
jgi:hypothetical protein